METTCPLTGFKGGVSEAKEEAWDDEREMDMEGEGNWLSTLMKKMPDQSRGHPLGPSLWWILPQGHCRSQWLLPSL